MKIVGHKTESIYRRYAITDEAMLQEADAKLSAFHRSWVKVGSTLLSARRRGSAQARDRPVAFSDCLESAQGKCK